MAFPNQRKTRRKVSDLDPVAAQRRREQTRIAQRAFRRRQENTVHSLNRELDQLRCTIEGLNNVFLSFTDILTKSGWLERDIFVAGELRNTIRMFIELTQPPQADTRGHDKGYQDNASKDTELHLNLHHPNFSPPATANSIYRAVDEGDSQPLLGRTTSASGTPTESPGLNLPTAFVNKGPEEDRLPNTIIPSPYLNLSALNSISWQPVDTKPVTFAQRLHQAAFQEGYRIIRNADQEIFNYQGVFCRMLESHTRDTLFWYFTKALHENLHGVLEPPEQSLLINDVEAEAGRWLNATDVYHYFKTRGVDFNESPMFAEIRMNDNTQSCIMTHGSSFGSTLAQSAALDSRQSLTSYSQPFTFFPITFFQNLNGLGRGSREVSNAQVNPSEKRVLVDVAKLINEIILPSQTQCRGRNPVFKKENLDRAMRRSVVGNY